MRARAYIGCLLFLAACSPRTIAVRQTASVIQHGLPAAYEEGDPILAEQSMPGQLKLLETLLVNDPGNKNLLVTLSQAFGGYAFLFIEDTDQERAKALYARARDYGYRALRRYASCDLANESDPARVEACLATFTKKKTAPALFWTAYSIAGIGKLSLDSPDSIADLAKAEKMMNRVNALWPDYFYGGPDTFLGSYYGGRSKILGGDPAKSKKYFDAAMAASGGKLLTVQLLYAKYYAVQFQDKALFHDLLTKAIDASPDILPEQRLANVVAQKKAKDLLKKENELFE